MDFTGQSTDNADSLTSAVESDIMSTSVMTPENPSTVSDSGNDSLSSVNTSFGDFVDGVRDSLSTSMSKGENALQNSLDAITSSITSITKGANETVDNAFSRVFSAVDQTKGLTNNKLTTFSSDLKEATSKAAVFSGDVLRGTIIAVENSIIKGASFVVYSYGSAKELLPPEIKDALNLSEEKTVQILRPIGTFSQQILRERDGIPDLRRAARFRYASVNLPEVDEPVRKLLKGGRDVDNSLIAAVIRNLKAVKDRSKVIVLDADGTYSKGIARSLRKLGVKRAYLVEGGFQSWAKQNLRVKELKPETALTVLNEEAEAILEDIRPSPVQVLGYSVGSVAALYAILEWEKTLQFIGVLGLAQSIYRRVVSYEGPEDFRQDVRLLLAPVRIGAQAISWAAGKLETNGIGLPTSPSSSDVQNRVLQAAAKHESQPSDTEGVQNPSSEPVAPINENVDFSEA
ncbi:conserved hypothetical protein [Ricinus communis]|uniref:Rhodanese domain-containing protein n=1 Tax=Ricinus communis TaxID=3988 RepID=B9SFU4_RICCO|nr:conserved hypothetical protein [Ricinus communis]